MKPKSTAKNAQKNKYINSFAQKLHEETLNDSPNERELTQARSNEPNYINSHNKQGKQHVLNTLNYREREIFQKVEHKVGRPLNDLETIDAVDRIIYEPEKIVSWLERTDREIPQESATVTTTTPEENFNRKNQPEPKKIADMSSPEKIYRAIKQAIFYLPVREENKFKALLTSKLLLFILSVLCIWRVSLFFIPEEIVGIGIALLGAAILGYSAIALYKDTIGFANAVNAVTEEDIEKAGKHLAKIMLNTEINLLLSLVIKKRK